MSERPITIKISWGWDGKPRIHVAAERVGEHFAVHRQVISVRVDTAQKFSNRWTVTHVPSGKNLLPSLRTKHRALKFARLLHTYGTRVGMNFAARTLRGMARGNGAGYKKFVDYRAKLIEELVR